MSKVYPRRHPLRSAYIKIQRAQVHINGLERRISRFIEANPPRTIVSEADSQRGIQQVNYPSAAPPDTWGAILGDACGNLRDSLDHIAWQLARLQYKSGVLDKDTERSIAFPLCDSKDHFREHPAIKYIIPASHHIIEKLQPYHREDWPELQMLEELDLFANFDKHRLIPTGGRHGSISVRPGQIFAMPIPRPNEGARVVIIKATITRDSSADLEPSPPGEIVFAAAEREAAERGPVIMRNIGYFSEIHHFIRDTVFPMFDGFFKNPPDA